MKQPSKVLEDRLRNLLERYEEALSEAVERVSERFLGSIESLIEEFGERAVGEDLRHCALTVLPKTLEDAFGPTEPSEWQDEG